MQKIKKALSLLIVISFLCAPDNSLALRPPSHFNKSTEGLIEDRREEASVSDKFLTRVDLEKQNFTFMMFKPDADAAAQEEILGEIQKRGFKIVYMGKPRRYTDEKAKKHYAEHDERHKNRPFYNSLVEYLTSGEAAPVILQKTDSANAVEEFKKLAGKSNGAEPGTLRYNRTRIIPRGPGINIEYNGTHASGSMAEALREISIIFTEAELKGIFDEDICLLIKNGLPAMEEDILRGKIAVASLLMQNI